MFPKCPKCEHTKFKAVLVDDVKDYNFKVIFICCRKCDTALTVTPMYDPTVELYRLAEKLGHPLSR